MTLIEKAMQEMKDERTLDNFIKRKCVLNCGFLRGHYDNIHCCIIKLYNYEECMQCWLQEYIEDPVYCELVENPDWIQIDEPVYKCTNCENSFVIISKSRSNICFCPHCGKRVELEIPF